MLSVKDIDVYYGNIHALKGLSLEVNEGEIVTLIGANGAGKVNPSENIVRLIKTKDWNYPLFEFFYCWKACPIDCKSRDIPCTGRAPSVC